MIPPYVEKCNSWFPSKLAKRTITKSNVKKTVKILKKPPITITNLLKRAYPMSKKMPDTPKEFTSQKQMFVAFLHTTTTHTKLRSRLDDTLLVLVILDIGIQFWSGRHAKRETFTPYSIWKVAYWYADSKFCIGLTFYFLRVFCSLFFFFQKTLAKSQGLNIFLVFIKSRPSKFSYSINFIYFWSLFSFYKDYFMH